VDPVIGKRRYRTGQDALGHAEAAHLLETIGDMADLALIHTAISTAMRREDIVNVRLQDVDLLTRRIRFFEKKKNRPWVARIDEACAKNLERYIGTLPRGTPWLFPSPRDPKKHIDDKSAYNRFQACLDRAGIRRRPFHALRATFIKLAKRRGWTMEQVMEQTGDSFQVIKDHYETPSDDEMDQVAKEKPLL
jgi:integrase